MTEPRRAPAADSPCELHRYHAPTVVRTQHHHSKPQYLQLRVWNEIRSGADTYVCGLCHDSIHAWLDWLLGEAYRPEPEPGRMAKAKAQEAYAWYQAAKP